MAAVFGVVKFVNPEKGFGFILLDGGAGDVHFWLDRGIVPAVGWKDRPMAELHRPEGAFRDELVAPPTPRRGDRLALEYSIPQSAKGPTASWWATEGAWRQAMNEIEARGVEYPVGLYYWPIVYGDGKASHVSYQYPGRHITYMAHYDGRVPAHWAVVEWPGELPHAPYQPSWELSMPDWDEYLPPAMLERHVIVRGRAEYVAALREELAEITAKIAGLGRIKRPDLLVDANGSGEVRYRSTAFTVAAGRVTLGEARAFGNPFAGMDDDHPDFIEGVTHDVVGGHRVADLGQDVRLLANILREIPDIRASWQEVLVKFRESLLSQRRWRAEHQTWLNDQIERREAEAVVK